MPPKIGDTIRFLNSVGGGIVRRIEGNIAYVDDNGFETPTLLRECVVVAQAAPTPTHKVQAPVIPDTVREEPLEPVEESPGGEKLNLVLAFEPDNIKELSRTTFVTYLVNDSNYYLSFVYLSRADESREWTLRYAGVVEPGIQLLIDEFDGQELPQMDRIAFQCIAYKEGKDFTLKNPIAVETTLDTTKFFKLHCFRPNPYFDTDVLAIDLVKDDVTLRRGVIDSSRLEEGIKAKKAVDRPKRKAVVKKPAGPKEKNGVLEVDLHIHELVDSTAGLTPADMLNLQIDTFRRVMDENLRNRGRKIVFIHGKGEGVLRQALMKELTHRYKGHDVQDASFREYGFGATQVTI